MPSDGVQFNFALHEDEWTRLLVGPFAVYTHDRAPPGPRTGWKIHVPATLQAAPLVVREIAKVANLACVRFKCLRSTRYLLRANEGRYGLTQVGKFATIYPSDASNCAVVVKQLAAALEGLRLPRVPFDRRVAPNTNIYLRFGAFEGCYIRSSLGELLPGRFDKAGCPVLDDRTSAPPSEAVLELLQYGIRFEDQALPKIFAGRFLATDLLHRGPRGSVLLGVDTTRLEKIIVKPAHKGDAVDRNGLDAWDRSRREGAALTRLAELPFTPKLLHEYETFETRANVLSFMHGSTLGEHVQGYLLRGDFVSVEEGFRIITSLRELLGQMESLGVIYTDLSPSNILIDENGSLGIIDFEHAFFEEDVCRNGGFWLGGTPGFCRPGFRAVERQDLASVLEYGLSALKYFLLSGVEPPACPRYRAKRIKTIRSELGSVGIPQATADNPSGQAFYENGEITSPANPFDVGLYNGSAGLLFTLLERYRISPTHALGNRIKELIRRASAHLNNHLFHSGFYVGYPGFAMQIRRAANFIEVEDHCSLVQKIDCLALGNPSDSPDLLNGIAGLLRYHLHTYLQTNDVSRLKLAQVIGNQLKQSCIRRADGLPGWVIPTGFGALSGQTLSGYAHGSAGIVDALLELHWIEDDAEVLSIADEVAAHLESRSDIRDGMWSWPSGSMDGGGPSWCHGAVGFGRFFLSFSRYDRQRSGRLISAIAEYLFRNARWQSVCYCHGIAGSIDFLIDAFRVFGEERYLSYARAIAFEEGFRIREARSASLFIGIYGVAHVFRRLRCEGYASPSLQVVPIKVVS